MEIPYVVTPRADTGLWNAKVGIWLFLASEIMLFGGLFSAYVFLRVGAAPGTWSHGMLNIPIGTFNTFVLIISSITIVMAWASLKLGQFNKYKWYMGATILLGLTFLVVKCAIEYPDKFHHYGVKLNDGAVITGHIESKADDHIMFKPDPKKGEHGHPAAIKIETENIARLSNFGPWYNTYFAIYFTLTALHGLHVLIGILVNLYFWGPGSAMYRTEPEHFTNRVEVSGLFWHFVDLVWIFLFPVLYLL